jgi:hypothetical protein
MFVVLQMRESTSPNLLEAILEIKDKETCISVDGEIRDGVICAGTPYECKGALIVRCLLY